MVVTPTETDITQHPVRVLVADDEPNIRKLLAATLAPQGYEVTAACDGDEARDFLRREPFEVVITDAQMPGLNGIDVLRFAKLMNPACQVFVITGHGGPEMQERALAYGAADYIQKPFSLEAISRAVALGPGDPIERAPVAAQVQTSLAEKEEQIGDVGEDSLRQPASKVLRYLQDHPEGADFDTLEKATGVAGRHIVSALAGLIDTGKARRSFPLFFAVTRGQPS